jgi:hypothetical protein
MNATLQEFDLVNERQGIHGFSLRCGIIVGVAGAVAWTF